jgi:hypothetical protein
MYCIQTKQKESHFRGMLILKVSQVNGKLVVVLFPDFEASITNPWTTSA